MSPNYEDLSEGLYQEVMAEAADNFFGRRRSVEDAKEVVEEQAEALRTLGRRVLARIDLLWALLLDGEAADDFFARIQGCMLLLPEMAEPLRAQLEFPPPKALTAKGRYVKLLQKSYALAQDGCEAYIHGRVITDEKGRKRRTVNYLRLMQMTDIVNHMVGKENTNNRASCVLQFTRSMNTQQARAEELMGGTGGGWDCDLDNSMALDFVNRRELGIVALPELPRYDDVRKTIAAFGKELYAGHGERLEAILDRLRQAADTDYTRQPRGDKEREFLPDES